MERKDSQAKKTVEASGLENVEDRNIQEIDIHTKPELDESNRMSVSDLEKTAESKVSELEGDASDLERRIFRNTSELKKRMKRNSSSDTEKKTNLNASELEDKKMSALEDGILKIGDKLDKGLRQGASELEDKNVSALEDGILKIGDKLDKGIKQGASELENKKVSALEDGIFKIGDKLDKGIKQGASELENKKVSALEDGILKVGAELEKGTSDSEKISEIPSTDSHDKGDEKVDETGVPLLVGDSISIEMKGGPEGKPTVHVHAKKRKEAAAKKRVGMNPMQRMRIAWKTSSNVCTFFLKAMLIIFATLGWMMCAGGVPFVSIAMIAIGSFYFDNCNVQPNIPLYLVVSGVCGTVQHLIAFWNKYLPEESQGRLSAYRRWYSLLDGAMTLFLFIWFILGCVWVYSVKEVDFLDDNKDEYCHKTLYYFAFWLLNISFIIIALIMVLGLCAILCIVARPKEEAVV